MRKYLFLLFMFVALEVNAQSKCTNDSTIVQYCLVMYNARDNAILLDMHTDQEYFVVGEGDTPIVFKSSISLLNYFAERGWEYVERFSDRKMTGTMPCFLIKKKGNRNTKWLDDISLQKL